MAQLGNTNAVNKGRFRGRLIKRIEDLKVLDKIVEALITKAVAGDMVAIKEISDRMDGKAQSSTEGNIAISVHVHRALEEKGVTIEHDQPALEHDN